MSDYPTGTLNPKGRKSAAQQHVEGLKKERDFWANLAQELGAHPLAYFAEQEEE